VIGRAGLVMVTAGTCPRRCSDACRGETRLVCCVGKDSDGGGTLERGVAPEESEQKDFLLGRGKKGLVVVERWTMANSMCCSDRGRYFYHSFFW